MIGDADGRLSEQAGWNLDLDEYIWFLYFSATFLLVIIMLNSLIAIIEDAYVNVN